MPARWFALAIALFSVALTSAASARAAAPTVTIQTWTREAQVHALEVDGVGFLWTASDRGLCRFDGTSWWCPATTCRGSLAVDAAGTVWGCAEDAGDVVSARGAELRRVSLPPLPGRKRALLGARGLELVLGTDTGVWTWSPGAEPKLVTREPARIAVAGADGQLWLGDDRGVRRADAAARLLTGRAEALNVDRRGRVFAGIQGQGLWELPAGREEAAQARAVAAVPGFVARSLAIDADRDVVWVAGQFNVLGYAVRDGRRIGEWGTKEGLPHPVVQALARDVSQGVLAGTSQGVAQLRVDDPLLALGRADGLPGDLAFSVAPAPDGSVWTTSTEGIARWDGRAVKAIDPVPAMPTNYARSVVATRDGTVWVGSPTAGLFTIKDGRLEPAHVPGLPAGFTVQSMREGPSGALWIGTSRCGVAKIQDGRYVDVLPPSPAAHCDGHDGPLTDLVEAADGALWFIAAERTVSRLRGGELRTWELVPGSPRKSAVAIGIDRAGAVWVGSAGHGLFRIKDDRVQRIRAAQGLWDDDVLAVVEDDDRRLWLGSRNGIFRVDGAELDAFFAGQVARVTSVAYQVVDGLRSNEGTLSFGCPALEAADGRLWFATVGGLVGIDPRRLVEPPPIRAVELVSAEVDGRAVPRDGGKVTSSTGELRFEAIAPSLWRPSRVRYRHRLDGVDPGWGPPTRDTVVRRSNVTSGRHVFHVQAFSLDAPGRVVEASWSVAIAPPWYRTAWFLGSLALLVTATAANAWRTRQLRLRRLEDAIQADRHRIARDIHDSLEQDLTGLKMQVEAASAWLDSDRERARGHLDRAAELIGDGMVDARNAVWGLRSAVVPSAELLAALELRLGRVVDPAGVTLSFEAAGPSRDLPSLTASQLVYIVREAVTNAVKHAKPRKVAVAVDLRDPDTVRVEVRDDGAGLAAKTSAPAGFATGMGLDGMRERVRGLGGTLEIASPPEGGTVVKVVAPLRRA